MKQFDTLQSAQTDPSVVFIERNVGGGWSGYERSDPIPSPPADPGIPQEVTMRQARRALLAGGLLAAVDTAINGMSEPAKTAARVDWEYSSTVQRNQPLVLALAPALGLTTRDLDNLFTAAAAIQ